MISNNNNASSLDSAEILKSVNSFKDNDSPFTEEEYKVALFAGKNAKTFPVIPAKKQEELIKSGATETDAFIETGVFNKVDAQSGKVIPEFSPQRFEIDDSKSKFISDSVWSMDDDESEKVQLSLGNIGTYKGDDIGSMRPKIERRGGGFANTPITYEQAGLEQNVAVSTLGKLLKHDDFFKAYPEFKDLRIELTTSDVNVVGEENMDNVDIQIIDGFMGAFYPPTSTRPGKIVMNMKYFKGGTADEIKKTLIHEIQHLIDDKEMTKDESLSPYTGANEQKDKYPYLKERRFPESSVTKEAWARESAFRMKLDKDERRKFVPFGLESRDDKINENKIDQIKRIKKHQETLPGYPERDKVRKESHKDFRQEIDKFEVEMEEEMKERRELENDPLYKKPAQTIQDKVYNHLINTEGSSGDTATGIPTGALGLTTKLYDSIKKKTGNSKMTEEEASRYYIDELYNNLSSLPGFTKLNDDEQVILVDTAYNVGWNNMSQWKGFAKGLATGNKEDAFRNLLDTANTEGGTSKGIAKRRALAYNEAFPNNKITHVVQTKDGLEYYKGKKLYFKYDTPPHKSSKIGTLKL
jgi:GH24 family phage-related lysozyme (muramidase)